MYTWTHHLRAAAVLAVIFLTLLLSTPGLDQFTEDSLSSDPARERALRKPLGRIEVVLSDVNRDLRMPLVELVQPIQRPLRIAQSWSLYGGGPNRVRRVEIDVDGVIRHRSKDPELDWLSGTFRYRRIRPMLSAICERRSKNAYQLFDFIARRAQRDFPGAKEVRVRCTSSRWPGRSPEISAEYRARAPDWSFR